MMDNIVGLRFPFGSIEKGSKVVLYGAGNSGIEFYKVNKELNWCEIVAVLDKNYKEVAFPIEVKNPQSIMNLCDYDRVFLSNESRTNRLEIAKQLYSYGVNPDDIVDWEYNYYAREFIVDYYPTFIRSGNENKARICVAISGGLGDFVINLSFITAIREKYANTEIDVVVIGLSLELVRELYYMQAINLIKHAHCIDDFRNRREYHAVFFLNGFNYQLLRYDANSISQIDDNMSSDFNMIFEYQQDNPFFFIPVELRNAITLKKAKLFNWNRYTAYNVNGIFDVSCENVKIHINGNFSDIRNKYALSSNYLTFHYGAGGATKDNVQTKMWPKEYYRELIRLLKKDFPYIMLVQVCGDNYEKIDGADRYIVKENINVVKHVLSKAVLHFDCEGGLTHLASQLKTKCCVVYGPTPSWFLGYKENINMDPVICGDCKNTCVDWAWKCSKYSRPECMYSIKPQMVLERISEYLHLFE